MREPADFSLDSDHIWVRRLEEFVESGALVGLQKEQLQGVRVALDGMAQAFVLDVDKLGFEVWTKSLR